MFNEYDPVTRDIPVSLIIYNATRSKRAHEKNQKQKHPGFDERFHTLV
jgi:hypothetical protein